MFCLQTWKFTLKKCLWSEWGSQFLPVASSFFGHPVGSSKYIWRTIVFWHFTKRFLRFTFCIITRSWLYGSTGWTQRNEFQVHLSSGALTKGIRMHVEEERRRRRLDQPVCFCSVLKEHPFISPPILASVVRPREAGEALSPGNLQRTTRASVPQTKCLSGPKDNVLEICDPCTACRRHDCSNGFTLVPDETALLHDDASLKCLQLLSSLHPLLS